MTKTRGMGRPARAPQRVVTISEALQIAANRLHRCEGLGFLPVRQHLVDRSNRSACGVGLDLAD